MRRCVVHVYQVLLPVMPKFCTMPDPDGFSHTFEKGHEDFLVESLSMKELPVDEAMIIKERNEHQLGH